jgi:hypothetical protein
MALTRWAWCLRAAAGVICCCLAVVGADDGPAEIPPLLTATAHQALRLAFPGAKATEVDTAAENGVEYFAVVLKRDGQAFRVEVSAEGVIIKVASVIQFGDLPPAVARLVTDTTKGAPIVRIAKHESRGRFGDGKFVAVTPSETRFEVKYTANGRPACIHVQATADGAARLKKLVIGKADDGDDDDDGGG